MEHLSAPPLSPAASSATAPRIWLLLSDKLGDNAQVNAVAGALGLPSTPKQLRFRQPRGGWRPAFKATLQYIDTDRSDRLAAPWPDLVIASGRRPGAVALWIKRASAGHSKIVIIGRPHRHLDAFDLVIAPPQFALPARPNILPLTVPLFAVDPAAIAAETYRWAPHFANLPRPLTAILLGGPQPPFRFNSAVARDVIARATAIADGGTLLILTSRRTPPPVVEALRQQLPINARLFAWDDKKTAANPYRAVLGLADRFIVSGDSVSMIGEVLSLGKPLAIAAAPLRRAPHIRLEQAIARRFRAASGDGDTSWSRLKRSVHRRGLLPFARDFIAFHESLFRRGLAVPLGTPFRQPPVPETSLGTASDTGDIAAVSVCIRALLGEVAGAARR